MCAGIMPYPEHMPQRYDCNTATPLVHLARPYQIDYNGGTHTTSSQHPILTPRRATPATTTYFSPHPSCVHFWVVVSRRDLNTANDAHLYMPKSASRPIHTPEVVDLSRHQPMHIPRGVPSTMPNAMPTTCSMTACHGANMQGREYAHKTDSKQHARSSTDIKHTPPLLPALRAAVTCLL